jgi:hypothetical protein
VNIASVTRRTFSGSGSVIMSGLVRARDHQREGLVQCVQGTAVEREELTGRPDSGRPSATARTKANTYSSYFAPD